MTAATAGPATAPPQAGRLGAALLLLGDRATLLILRNAFLLRTTRFGAWREQLGMSESVLAERLAGLVDAELLERVPVGPAATRHEYRLTERGRSVWVLLVALVAWERAWSPAGGLQPALRHETCGAETRPLLVCGRDGATIGPGDTTVVLPDPTAAAGAVPPRVRRRSARPDAAHPELALDATLTVIGDRWSAVLVGLALTGVRRFAELQRATGASPTVLSDRLRRLVEADVLRPVVPDGARRAEYRLTRRGAALLPFYALLVAWSDRWLGDDGPRALRILHDGHDLRPRLACSACGAPLRRREVRFR